MSLTYERASAEIDRLVEDAMTRWHPELVGCDVRVSTLMISAEDENGEPEQALKHHGYRCAATIAITPLKQRALGVGDAVLTIDAATWGEAPEARRLAILDHELEPLRGGDALSGPVAWADDGLVGTRREDDLGRPVLKLRLHDWQLGGFRSVARRHLSEALEVAQARACVDEAGQYYWDWTALARDAAVSAGRPPLTVASVTLSGPGEDGTMKEVKLGAAKPKKPKKRAAVS